MKFLSFCQARGDGQPHCSPHRGDLKGSALTRAVLILCVEQRVSVFEDKTGAALLSVLMSKPSFSEDVGGQQ